MHNHNNNKNCGGNNKSMMWMMIPCLLMVALLLFSGSKFTSSKYLWLIVIGICVIPHIWMMFKGHKKEDSTDNPENNKDEHSKHNGCCH